MSLDHFERHRESDRPEYRLGEKINDTAIDGYRLESLEKLMDHTEQSDDPETTAQLAGLAEDMRAEVRQVRHDIWERRLDDEPQYDPAGMRYQVEHHSHEPEAVEETRYLERRLGQLLERYSGERDDSSLRKEDEAQAWANCIHRMSKFNPGYGSDEIASRLPGVDEFEVRYGRNRAVFDTTEDGVAEASNWVAARLGSTRGEGDEERAQEMIRDALASEGGGLSVSGSRGFDYERMAGQTITVDATLERRRSL